VTNTFEDQIYDAAQQAIVKVNGRWLPGVFRPVLHYVVNLIPDSTGLVWSQVDKSPCVMTDSDKPKCATCRAYFD
jgi:hypothetical protein